MLCLLPDAVWWFEDMLGNRQGVDIDLLREVQKSVLHNGLPRRVVTVSFGRCGSEYSCMHPAVSFAGLNAEKRSRCGPNDECARFACWAVANRQHDARQDGQLCRNKPWAVWHNYIIFPLPGWRDESYFTGIGSWETGFSM
jgi:hypothetical protein